MKKTFLLLTALVSSTIAFAQTYVSLATSIYAQPGTFRERLGGTIEVGRQWSVLSLGIDVGKTTFAKQAKVDTTWFTELRPNLNVFQQGKFTNTLTVGVGYVFNAKNNTLFELSTGIQFQPDAISSYNIYFGQYYFTGKTAATTANYLGISAMFYFIRKKK
jgi:hypothetical protein